MGCKEAAARLLKKVYIIYIAHTSRYGRAAIEVFATCWNKRVYDVSYGRENRKSTLYHTLGSVKLTPYYNTSVR